MARNIQSLLRITTSVFNRHINNNISVNGTRSLYSASALGIDGYLKGRNNVQQQFLSMGDKFREKMQTYVNQESQNMIFTEDLKNMLHLVESKQEDIDLLMKMMTKFNSQNKEMRFGSYVFGPVVMRAYHYLNKPDDALDAFNNPQLAGFFDQVNSYQILMDLLYNNGKYNEIREVFETIKKRNTTFTKYPRQVVTLVLAGCYKENTPESMEYALGLWQEMKERDSHPTRRSSTFFAALALNQGKPNITAEVMFNEKQGSYITIRNLKVAGLADLNRLDDLVAILRMSLTNDSPSQIKHTYAPEVIEKVEQAIERAQLGENDQIVNLIKQLRENGHVIDTTLDSLITAEIVGFLKNQQGTQFRDSPRNNYQSNSRYEEGSRPYRSFNNQYQRAGLKELV